MRCAVIKSLAVHYICCDSNADEIHEIVFELHIGTDHDVESQLDGKINHDGFNPIRNRPLRSYFLSYAKRVKISVVLVVQ